MKSLLGGVIKWKNHIQEFGQWFLFVFIYNFSGSIGENKYFFNFYLVKFRLKKIYFYYIRSKNESFPNFTKFGVVQTVTIIRYSVKKLAQLDDSFPSYSIKAVILGPFLKMVPKWWFFTITPIQLIFSLNIL